MHVRPLRRPKATTGEKTQAAPANQATQQEGSRSPLPIIGRRLAASSSFVLARACRRGAAGAPA